MEFEIDELKGYSFRFKKVSPVKLLALQTSVNIEDFNKAADLYAFILESTEVKIAEAWVNVKEKGREVYLPVGIEDNGLALMAICAKFMTEVLKPVFQSSRG